MGSWPDQTQLIGRDPQTRLVSKQVMKYMASYSFIAYVSPYVLSLLPPGTVPVSEDGNSSSSTLKTSRYQLP